ncbi:MAG TPA: hypothetical protein VGB87_21350 [Vicinamibacteria bacterium]
MTLHGPGTPAGLVRVEVDVRHQDILLAEADAIGCLLTPRLEPDDEPSRKLFAAAGQTLREDIRWALTRRGRLGLEPGEALTLAVRSEYPVGRVGFLILAASAREREPEEREALVLAAFLREALEWGFESLALPVSDRGVEESLAVAASLLARTIGERRPLLKRVHFLSRDAALLDPARRGVA